LLADEGVDREIVESLRADGHSVIYMAEGGSGAADPKVLNLAVEHRSVLITSDKDFGELVFRRSQVSHGVLLIRLAGVDGREKARLVRNTIARHADELACSFTVISPGQVRVRRLLE